MDYGLMEENGTYSVSGVLFNRGKWCLGYVACGGFLVMEVI